MKKFFILLLIVLFFSVSAVAAEGNFTSLQSEIEQSSEMIEISQDYVYDVDVDSNISDGIYVNKKNFVIEGNGHTIDAKNYSRIFQFAGDNITLSNLILTNGFAENGGAITTIAPLTLDNVTFISNRATDCGGAISTFPQLVVNNCLFDSNYAKNGAAISSLLQSVIIIGSTFQNFNANYAIVNVKSAIVVNSTFMDSSSQYATAIYTTGATVLNNTNFINLHANKTAGAVGLKNFQLCVIDNCTFINTTAVKNGGAVYLDTENFFADDTAVLVNNSKFINSSGDFGGAFVHLSGNLSIENSLFWNNVAKYAGGAVYVSEAPVGISNTTFLNNRVSENYTQTGAFHLYMGGAAASDLNFINNTGAIYVKEAILYLNDSYFDNNGYGVYSVYDNDIKMNNNIFKNSNYSLNNTDYIYHFDNEDMNVDLINNTITVDKLPKYFNLNDWGWVSSIKDQGSMGACWAFGITGSLESALLKATGVEYTFSVNNMKDLMLKYSSFGSLSDEGGLGFFGVAYLLSWLGAFSEEYDTYDELGKLSPIIFDVAKYHVHDVVIIPPRKNVTDNNLLKRAIIDYGSLIVGYMAHDSYPYYNGTNGAQYYNETGDGNHMVSLVGWDDNYSKNNFIITPPGDGAWIIKNSYGENHGVNGYDYVSYYDLTFSFGNPAYAFIISESKNYTGIYQTDYGAFFYINTTNQTVSYKNNYDNSSNELISAIGTFFRNANQNYTFEIYVNDNLKLTQNGTSYYAGYHTIDLQKEIPLKNGDNFTVVMTTDSLPLLNQSRIKFQHGRSYVKYGDEWEDLSLKNATVSLKVYTKGFDLYTEDLVKIYKNDSKFEANIGVANETVTFKVNGVNYNRTSDEKGVARISINLNPGNYTIKTIFNGTTVENTITVLPTLIANNLVKYFRNDSQFYVSLIDGEGKPVSNVNITMNINGVLYNRTTNENGTARLNINLNPGVYILTAIDYLTGLQMSYNITVLPVLTAEDLNMVYKDGSTFNATLVDGQGNPLFGVDLTFNINGVFYNRTTDENGVAKLNINLMAGEYIITSQYGQAMLSNKITIAAKEE